MANQSPTPTNVKPKQRGMDFPTALREIIDGKKITKLGWGNPGTYFFLHADEKLKIFENGKTSDLILRQVDLIGTDWVVVK